MLVLSRKRHQIIRIDDDIVIKVVKFDGRGTVQIGIEAPRSRTIVREEMYVPGCGTDRVILTEAMQSAAIAECPESNHPINRNAFALGFRAGVAFACRSMPDLHCFCGNHISQVDG